MDSVRNIAALPVPLGDKLRLLREQAREAAKDEALNRWAQQYPEIASGTDWCERAWWGVAAGEMVRTHLYDPVRHPVALELLERADWSMFEEVRHGGGFIIATAHLGPPKFLMNAMLDTAWPLLVWTNTRDMPAWLSAKHASTFLNPMISSQRSVMMIQSALHLRQGGVLLGAADMTTGERNFTLERLGRTWSFSPGLPALSRNLNVPVIFCLALWTGHAVEIRYHRMEQPDRALPEESWYEAWIETYWRLIEPVIRTSPENLRCMRRIVQIDPATREGR